jgi:arylformamidase
MELTATINEKNYAVNMHRPHDISIPVRFDGTSLSAFGAPGALREAYTADAFIGDVSKGGSCNCDMLRFSPHLHGTHTECVGHIADAPLYMHNFAKEGLIPATLVTVTPDSNGSDFYIPKRRPQDRIISKDMIARALISCEAELLEALVIRTLPNETSKMTRIYGEEIPPFFSIEAIRYLASCGVKHLLVDIPSIDRLDDEGKLTNHHLFWGVEEGSHAVNADKPSPKTITELIYVPRHVKDGMYMLSLQVAPFASDAAPSRPILYEVTPA